MVLRDENPQLRLPRGFLRREIAFQAVERELVRMPFLLTFPFQAARTEIVQLRIEQIVSLKERVEILEIFPFRNPAVFVFVIQALPLVESLSAFARIADFADTNDVIGNVFPAA